MTDESYPDDLPPAYFLSLTLENVRCFQEEVTLDLMDDEGNPAQWTVLLGDNGTGKTTLLQGLIVTSPVDMGTLADENVPIVLSMMNGYNMFEEDLMRRVWATSQRMKFGATLSLGARLTERSDFQTRELHLTQEGRAGSGTGQGYTQDTAGLRVYGYGASREMDMRGLFQDTGAHFQPRSMDLGLFLENKVLPNVREWLLETHYAVSRGQTGAEDRLDTIVSILSDEEKGILPDVDGVRFMEETNSENAALPRVEFHTPYGWVTIDQLSLGYRTMIAWVVDLARRLFKRYPDSDNPLAEPAVCLVDEIDLHLHPKWQRKIIDFLSERFPNTQFVVTAHSPLVVQAAEDANIALLERVEVEDGDDYVEIENNPARIRNWRVDQILTSDLFDLDSARPPNADKLMQEREEILAKEKLTEEDEQRLDEIEEELGDLPTGETPDDIEAMNLIRQAARELKEDA